MSSQISSIKVQSMSSLEIATLTCKDHKNVIRDIKVVLNELKDGSIVSHQQYQEVKDNRGYTQEFILDKEITMILVSGYSIVMRAKIVRRLEQLEKASQKPQRYIEPFRQRAMLNRPLIDDDKFSIIDRVDEKIVSGLETLGAPIPDNFHPDISVGIMWSKYLKQSGRTPESLGATKYSHQYQDGRIVQAWQYPNILYDEFHTWLRSRWMLDNMQKYFDNKDSELMEYAYIGVEKHLLPKTTKQLNKPIKQTAK